MIYLARWFQQQTYKLKSSTNISSVAFICVVLTHVEHPPLRGEAPDQPGCDLREGDKQEDDKIAEAAHVKQGHEDGQAEGADDAVEGPVLGRLGHAPVEDPEEEQVLDHGLAVLGQGLKQGKKKICSQNSQNWAYIKQFFLGNIYLK